MTRKILLIAACVMILAAAGFMMVSAQEEEMGHPIITTNNEVVGIGTYVAYRAFAEPAGENPEEAPVNAYALPYTVHPNMHVMDLAELEVEPLVEGFTFEWTLLDPNGDEAEVMGDTVIYFMADIAGRYDLTLTATDENGNMSEVTKWVYATTYVGNGGTDPTDMQCGFCHDDMVEAWLQTGHADMLVRGLDGTLSDHYSEGCISCHTTGYGPGENGGFDDLQAEYGWEFPVDEEGHAILEEGGYAAFAEAYPEVAELANIQCESCHGPGYLHVMEASRRESMISTGLDYGTCAQCHAEDPYHVFPQQWEKSGHGTIISRAFTYPTGEDHAACVRCHSGAGYIDYSNGVPEEEQRVDYQPITCAVCHDPHDAANPNQLRIVDTTVLPDGTELTGLGANATCMSCHNARVDANVIIPGALEGGRFGTPHYSTGAELMHATGGYTFGMEIASSGHTDCIGCHMADTPGTDADGNDLPGRHEVGQHTFSMVSEEGVENVAACQTCHAGATTIDFESARDYDGDGAYESVSEEVAGLQEILQASLEENSVVVLGHYPYFEIPEGASEEIFGGIWNLKFSQSGGSAIHNFRYTVALLQLSIDKLGGTYGDALPMR
jgi:hypothetical protein